MEGYALRIWGLVLLLPTPKPKATKMHTPLKLKGAGPHKGPTGTRRGCCIQDSKFLFIDLELQQLQTKSHKLSSRAQAVKPPSTSSEGSWAATNGYPSFMSTPPCNPPGTRRVVEQMAHFLDKATSPTTWKHTGSGFLSRHSI